MPTWQAIIFGVLIAYTPARGFHRFHSMERGQFQFIAAAPIQT